jgi:hypothetical protein
MVDRVLITDRRRRLLNENLDETRGSINVEKTRIRKRARIAIQELVEIARSDAIDNEDIFQPEDLNALITAIMEENGLVSRNDFDGTAEEHTKEYSYKIGFIVRLDNTVSLYHDKIQSLGRFSETVPLIDHPEPDEDDRHADSSDDQNI